jgi:hypothetical protein
MPYAIKIIKMLTRQNKELNVIPPYAGILLLLIDQNLDSEISAFAAMTA